MRNNIHEEWILPNKQMVKPVRNVMSRDQNHCLGFVFDKGFI